MKFLTWDGLNPNTGLPLRFDEPNIFWGNPSYALEPSDPGYICQSLPLLTPNQNHKTKTKGNRIMTHQTYFPAASAAQIGWLDNFWNKLQTHSPVLGITGVECALAVAECRWCIYGIASWLPYERARSKASTQALQELLSGTGVGPYLLPAHVPPPLPGAVPGAVPPLPAVLPMPAGSLNRLFALVQKIKDAPGYTDTIGLDLGIIGSQKTGPDLITIQPHLTVTLSGGAVQITWNYGGFSDFLDMLEIQVDRGQGWLILAFDTTPDYTDTAPHPAALTQWKYRAIWRVGDHQVGQWSAEVKVTLG